MGNHSYLQKMFEISCFNTNTSLKIFTVHSRRISKDRIDIE